MKKSLISIIACPKCKSSLRLEEGKKSENRIREGKLICEKYNHTFEIIDEIACFRPISKNDKNKKELQKIKDLFLIQELNKKWLKHFTKQERSALEEEWSWMIKSVNLKRSKIHLDWATGTGRFLRYVLRFTRGEVVALEIDYASCVGLKIFLKKIDAYDNVTIICGDAQNMPFSPNSIDSISSWHGLDEPNVKKALDESERVLKINKMLAVSGLFYKRRSESLKLAIKSGIKFAHENDAYRYFKKLGFQNINYKTFFKGKWLERKSFLPLFGDDYTSYAISGKK